MRRRRGGGDPGWITARYAGKCTGNRGECPQVIKRGERAFYYPNGKHLLAQGCGHAEAAEADFASMRFDESGGAEGGRY